MKAEGNDTNLEEIKEPFDFRKLCNIPCPLQVEDSKWMLGYGVSWPILCLLFIMLSLVPLSSSNAGANGSIIFQRSEI